MADKRHQIEEDLVLEGQPARRQAGGQGSPDEGSSQVNAPAADTSPGAGSPGGSAADGRSAAAGAGQMREQGGEPSERSDEDALRGDVDELVAAAAQRDEYLALAQRTQADFENYRKRVAKESAAAQERGVAKLAKELLPALDNLDRALEECAAQGEGSEDALLSGVRLVRSELHAALARLGIERLSPEGEPFDPAEHEAISQQPSPGAQSGSVLHVLQPGYRLGNTIIRPARVVVAA